MSAGDVEFLLAIRREREWQKAREEREAEAARELIIRAAELLGGGVDTVEENAVV